MELPEGYTLEKVENGNRVLRRPSGYTLAVFGNRVSTKNIWNVAEADKGFLEAKRLNGSLGVGRDPESAYMFGEGVREAREKYLLALERAYRE